MITNLKEICGATNCFTNLDNRKGHSVLHNGYKTGCESDKRNLIKIYVSNSVCTKDWSHKTIPKVKISKNDISKKSHYRL